MLYFIAIAEEPKRENVFYIEFPANWETQDIYDLFAPFGGIFIAWIDDKSAFVALQNQDNVKKGNFNFNWQTLLELRPLNVDKFGQISFQISMYLFLIPFY